MVALFLALFATASAGACPIINGQFTREITGSSIVAVYTKFQSGKYLYNFDVDKEGPFLPADGLERAVKNGNQSGFVRISCTSNSVTFNARGEGIDPIWITYTLSDKNTLDVTSNFSDMVGKFKN